MTNPIAIKIKYALRLDQLASIDTSLDDWIKATYKQCNAVNRQGNRCKRLAIPGKNKCRNHGGLSTGPKTKEGKAKVTKNFPHMK